VFSLITSGAMADVEESEWGVWGEENLFILNKNDSVTKTSKKDALVNISDDGFLPKVSGKNKIGLTSSMEDRSIGDSAVAVDKTDGAYIDKINQVPVEMVYGTGVSGSDENILHQLDQSSLLDYQNPIEINFDLDFHSENEDVSTSLGVGEDPGFDAGGVDGLDGLVE